MALNNHELFVKLLEQLDLADQAEQDYFKDAEIKKLEVHEQSKIWHFFL